MSPGHMAFSKYIYKNIEIIKLVFANIVSMRQVIKS